MCESTCELAVLVWETSLRAHILIEFTVNISDAYRCVDSTITGEGRVEPEPPLDIVTKHDHPSKTWIVLPAFNAERTLERTLLEIPSIPGATLLLVDDGSTDRTVDVARQLGLQVVRHTSNKGYGANQKTCYAVALDGGADYVLMLHPDNQYDARVLPAMLSLLQLGICDVMLGNRIRTRHEALSGGMPKWKYATNRVSTLIENLVLGQSIGDFHSGLRGYSRRVLETIPFDRNSNDFGFDQEFLVQAVHFGFRIGDLPVPVRYFAEASSIGFSRSLRYGTQGLGAIGSLQLHRLRIRSDPRFIPLPSRPCNGA
jgi:glycosyltransferase involved in cell wall biosynthesis